MTNALAYCGGQLIAKMKKVFSESAAGFNEIGAELVWTDSKIKINGHFKKCEEKQIFGRNKNFSA